LLRARIRGHFSYGLGHASIIGGLFELNNEMTV
jgi:hypothetical protein